MNNNQISNPKTEVSSGIQLNDKDYLNSLLFHLKEMAKGYVVVMTEASNESLFEKYNQMFNSILKMQRSVYELMFRKGWYNIEVSENAKINDKYNMLNKEYTELNK